MEPPFACFTCVICIYREYRFKSKTHLFLTVSPAAKTNTRKRGRDKTRSFGKKNVANIVGQWSVNLTIGYQWAGLQLMLGSCALRLWKVLMPFYHVKRWNRQEMMIFSWIYMKIRRLPWCSANFLVSFWKSETSFLENFDFFFFFARCYSNSHCITINLSVNHIKNFWV